MNESGQFLVIVAIALLISVLMVALDPFDARKDVETNGQHAATVAKLEMICPNIGWTSEKAGMFLEWSADKDLIKMSHDIPDMCDGFESHLRREAMNSLIRRNVGDMLEGSGYGQ